MYYISFEYKGNDNVKPYKDWFIYRQAVEHDIDCDDIMAINTQAQRQVMNEFNIEQEDISDSDIVLILIKEI